MDKPFSPVLIAMLLVISGFFIVIRKMSQEKTGLISDHLPREII